MKFAKICSVAAAIFLLLPCAARAAEEPEAVYAKFHRAVASGNLEETLRYGPEVRRAEVAAMSAAEKEAAIKMMRMLLPRAYLLRNKTLGPDGRSARLIVSGPGEALPGEKPETMFGTIRMVMERGEWKVYEVNWSNEQPGILSRGQPAGTPPAQKAAGKGTPGAAPVPNAAGAPVVGSMSSSSERKFGSVKEPCVFKPVMTAEDMERCK